MSARRVGQPKSGVMLGGLFVLSLMLMYPQTVWAAPSLYTAQAEVAEGGDIELAFWLESYSSRSDKALLVMTELGVGTGLGFELAGSAGLGVETGPGLTLQSPCLSLKRQIREPELGWSPGVAFAIGFGVPYGRGLAGFDEASLWLLAPVSFVLLEERLQLHGNIGLTSGLGDSPFVRPFWALAAEVVLPRIPVSVAAELFAGDPFEPSASTLGSQVGLVWLRSRGVMVDAAFAFLLGAGDLADAFWVARLGVMWTLGDA